MRRIVLALAMTAGLAIGTVVPASALDTSVTLNCSDGTSVKLVVDADTLTGLTQAVQAMIDYPAGLSCTLIQNPLGVTFGQIALAASPGTNPFIVGGGRWQAEVSCAALGDTGVPGGAIDGGLVAARVAGRWSYQPTTSPSQVTAGNTLIWVNIAVNVHQRDDDPSGFFGTLNETIPTQQITGCSETFTSISERHFTSKPTCLQTLAGSPKKAVVTSLITQTSGAEFPGAVSGSVNFSFEDNGNPGGGNPPDKLQGPPEEPNSACPAPAATPPDGTLVNGNISIRNPT